MNSYIHDFALYLGYGIMLGAAISLAGWLFWQLIDLLAEWLGVTRILLAAAWLLKKDKERVKKFVKETWPEDP
jgi:hypothetical protein